MHAGAVRVGTVWVLRWHPRDPRQLGHAHQQGDPVVPREAEVVGDEPTTSASSRPRRGCLRSLAMTTVNRFDLTGKVALVTGSTKGLGRAMAQGLAEAGADVVVSSRKQDLCDAAAADIAASTGRRVFGLACHVGDWDAIP